ncbi:MAG: hypothetical protein ACI8WB_001532 [Phenylobacterium sp.]|jgi:hypothetical protein
MIISINQPAYLPWLGYFARIAQSDRHVVLDHVQFEKNSMVNRNKIKTAQGWCWLSVPLKTSGQFGDLAINTIEINSSQKWQKKHWNSLYFNYKKAPFFDLYAEQLNACYQQPWHTLGDLLKWQLDFLLKALNISTPIIYSSAQDYQSSKSELVLDICQSNEATTYLSGPFGRDYLEKDQFAERGIEIAYQDYQHPCYQQAGGAFISHLSVFDLLCFYGPDSLAILLAGNEP